MKHVFWLLGTLSSVYAVSLRYTIESYTVQGKPCMSDCINGKCKAGSSSYNMDDCRPGKTVGYQYYTALKERNIPLCLSRCGSFGKDYEWCYVNDKLDWDYCSSRVAKVNDKNIQSYTRRGEKCIGKCGKHQDKSYNWCKTLKGWDYCAMPAKSIFGKNCHGQCSKRTKRNDAIDELNGDCVRRPGLVRDLAAVFESFPSLDTRRVNEPGNTVYSYTVGPPNVPNEPQLPFVVRAQIISQYLPPPNSRTSDAIPSAVRTNLRRMGLVRGDQENNNDEAGHLIAYQNGGPAAVYNFAPQTRRLNRGTNDQFVEAPSIWYQDEFAINAWVRAGGTVDEVVVVLYDDPERNFRPIGFGTSIQYFNPDGTLDRTCPDYFFSNDPSFY